MQFTNHTVGRIAPALLTLIISLYFFVRGRGQKASFWLGLYFALLSVFNIGYILGYSVDHPRGGYAWYLACAISFAAAARIQFAYSFPSEFRPREKRAALILAFAASGAALVDYGLRVGSDFGFNLKHHLYGSTYSSLWVPMVSFVCFFWSIVVSVRRALELLRSGRKKSGSLVFAWRNNPEFRAVCYLAGLTTMELLVNGAYLLEYGRAVRTQFLPQFMNVSLLVIFGGYVLLYSTAPSTRTGFLSKLVGVCLVSVLPMIGALGSAFQNMDLDRFLGERMLVGRTALQYLRQGNPVPSSVAFIVTDSDSPVYAITPGAADAARSTDVFDGRFYFAQSHSERYFSAIISDEAGHRTRAGFRYEDYRARLDESSRLIVYALVMAALIIALLFPFLFRASLLMPLRLLLNDLKQIKESKVDPGLDEIGALRASFGRMLDLIRETSKRIPDFAPHLNQMEDLAATEPGRIEIGGRTLIYRSRAMRRLIEQVARAREYRFPVLITGETGTGKELVARMVHSDDPVPFVAVNCAALPETLWESEVFGHKKGAFTDAKSDRRGRIVEAGDGVLFFDEIGEMPLAMQAKMLRLLQEGQFSPVGSDLTLTAGCRFIFATNRNLADLVKEKKFREDLLYRIRVFHLEVPPLRERPEDIGDLLRFFMERFARDHKRTVPSLEPAALHALVQYRWPGNIREVENAVIRAMAAGSDVLGSELFPEVGGARHASGASSGVAVAIDLDSEIRRYSRSLIERALEQAKGNKTQAAELLGIKRTTLRYRMRDIGLED
ncbi:MAG TPA: sigma-54 dependent transcriptional regulator [Leptospiraceae bacterium]|nr:sigma-54 dependent transcriptional regulator [Leptospirales bacterium]HMX56498.1 sigma-54 dependent transcriptional regulator [Leptospiraceae bacterium]HNJ34668.1 sigma-54 dependent transcriptional regulator [Leptospiraceae bacterium]HNN60298.1 sigma-54 dependent transcriptional regulator [Leptospiraceae bacterium]HNN73453.1 sigma-54 dependent transcriptional regulator [Leptospiraceae bacterium]